MALFYNNKKLGVQFTRTTANLDRKAYHVSITMFDQA